MKRILTLLISLLFAILLIGCNNSNSTSANNEIDVKIDAKPIFENGKASFDISTNLPDESELMITLSNESIDYVGQCKSKVTNGNAKTEQFSSLENPLEKGKYTLRITTSAAKLQPDLAREKLGEKGENLSGEYIKNDETFGKSVSFETYIDIN